MRIPHALPILLAALAAAALPACGQPASDPPKEKGKKEGKTLSVGDPAPPWKVDRWLNGAAVPAPDKDKVYVLEFWATWCGPCIKAMPHLAALQEDHKADGLVVIGMTHKDENGNDLKSVTEFVTKRGPKLGYVFGYSETADTHAAYMDAAGQDGIPCSFVIDRGGKVAYIGHPMTLDDVLPKVLAGKWNPKDDLPAIDAMNRDWEGVLRLADKEPAKALDELTGFAQKHPAKAAQPPVRAAKLALLLMAKRYDEAKAEAEGMVAESEKKKRVTPAEYVLPLANPQLNPDKMHIEVAAKAADLVAKYADDDYALQLGAAEAYMAAGQADKAKAAGAAAVAAAPTPKAKEQIGKIVDKILGAKK